MFQGFDRFQRSGRLRLPDQFNNNAGAPISATRFLCWFLPGTISLTNHFMFSGKISSSADYKIRIPAEGHFPKRKMAFSFKRCHL